MMRISPWARPIPWFNALDFPLIPSFDTLKSNRYGFLLSRSRSSPVSSVEPLSTMISSAWMESDSSNELKLAINLCKLALRLYVGTITLMWGSKATNIQNRTEPVKSCPSGNCRCSCPLRRCVDEDFIAKAKVRNSCCSENQTRTRIGSIPTHNGN